MTYDWERTLTTLFLSGKMMRTKINTFDYIKL